MTVAAVALLLLVRRTWGPAVTQGIGRTTGALVVSVALAIMISNHIVMPLLLRGRGVAPDPDRATAAWARGRSANGSTGGDLGSQVVHIRRGAIIAVILLGYAYYRASG